MRSKVETCIRGNETSRYAIIAELVAVLTWRKDEGLIRNSCTMHLLATESYPTHRDHTGRAVAQQEWK